MYKSILVPISFDENRQADQAMEVAKVLCDDDGRITLLHVMEQAPGYAVSYLPADYIEKSRAAIAAELDKLAARIRGAQGKVVSGHSARTILDYAEDNKNDLIVIASHRPGMQDLLLGSTATSVVRHARCAVHVIR
ncbi:universal stress protein [Aestuariicoccus sp. MJ-SS9]|uniref:universal stress protein n=1 Tax=Aestuariicoccus sp. MJ-SS9 TaxID=3079855 RepID=UPI0029080C60|nr:universal stress protein [Aestuariicoccus sp. MJ-SS9]MDU8911797.1 universal stress protein [Aestuariicoccus sp. MJ-SS9]